MTDTKDGAILAFACLLANPPPEVIRMNKLQRFVRRGSFKLAAIDSVAIPLQDGWSLVYECGEKPRVAWLVEAPHKPPWFSGHTHIFRMAVRAALLAKFGLEYVEQRDFLAVGIARFHSSKATGNLFAY
jgi:hypothetical protein